MNYLMHQPVMLQVCLDALAIKSDGIYIDVTYGRGGHSSAILEQIGPGGRLICFDQDADAIAHAAQSIAKDERVTVVHAPFSSLPAWLNENGLMGKIDGLLMDIGVSSPQLDEAHRGFSFLRDGPLDMRMDQSREQTAYDYLMSVDEVALANVIYTLGDERHSRRIAKKIVEARAENQLLDSTACLADLVIAAGVKRDGKKHPATRTFQAIRMVVNQEVDELKQLLDACPEIIKVGGRLVVMSFHGLEHRVVKDFIRDHRVKTGKHVFKQLEKVKADEAEVEANIRARSAYVRIIEKRK